MFSHQPEGEYDMPKYLKICDCALQPADGPTGGTHIAADGPTGGTHITADVVDLLGDSSAPAARALGFLTVAQAFVNYARANPTSDGVLGRSLHTAAADLAQHAINLAVGSTK